MNFNASRVVRAAIMMVAIASISGCVSPAARIPCDGKLEPINTPAKKLVTSDKRSETTSRVSP